MFAGRLRNLLVVIANRCTSGHILDRLRVRSVCRGTVRNHCRKSEQMTRIISIQSVVNWRAFKGASGVWVATCDDLSLAVEGDTWAELMEASVEATNLLLE